MATDVLEQERAVETFSPDSGRLIASGAAVAAMIAAMLGMLTLALVNLGAEASEAFASWVHGIGKLWMPGAPGIGPYSGKETLALVAWIVSWAILHPALGKKDLNIARWLVTFLIGVGVATTLIWPPVYGYLAGH